MLELPWEISSDILSCQCSNYVYILLNHSMATKAQAVIVSKIVKRVVSHVVFTSHARNVCLQHERTRVDVGATSPTTSSVNSVIQICTLVLDAYARSFSSSTSKIFLCVGGGHFELEHIMKRLWDLLHC